MEIDYLASGYEGSSERSDLTENGGGYDLIILTRPRRDLPAVCTEAMKTLGVRARQVSIMWDENMTGWQQLKITTHPCAERVVMELAGLLSEGKPAKIIPVRPQVA